MTEMTHPPDDDGSGGKPRKKRSAYENAPYKIGKGKPPVKHQFKKGGKPGPGRPRGSRNRSDPDEFWNELVTVGEDRLGRPIRKARRRFVDMHLFRKVAEGDIAAIKIAKDAELRWEAIKAKRGDAPLTAEELLNDAKKDEEKRRLSELLSKSMIKHLDMMGELKRRGLIGGPNPQLGGWTRAALTAFDMIASREIYHPEDDWEVEGMKGMGDPETKE